MFSYKGVEKGTLTSDWSIIEGNEIAQGKIRIGGTAGGGTFISPSNSGSLVKIKLHVECGIYTIETESQLRIENYTDDIVGFSPDPCPTNFTFVPCPRLGDVNGDGDITPGDAQTAFEIYIGKLTPDFCQETTSDANCDESTTPGDAQDIFDHFLGRKSLPECCNGSSLSFSTSYINYSRKIRDKKKDPTDKPKLYPLDAVYNPGQIINVPIIITNPEEISSFSFEVNYLPELLEYRGIKKSVLTNEFDYVRGIEEIEGLIRVEGEGKQPISYDNYSSLAVLVFRAKEIISGKLPIIVFSPGRDLFNVDIDEDTSLYLDYSKKETGFISIEKAIIMPDGTLRIPVKVSNAFNMKSFGLEIKYPTEKMLFIGTNRGELTENFIALGGNELEAGVVKVGGYSMSGIQERGSGILVELVFCIKEIGGKIEIVKLVDDIKDYEIQKRSIGVIKRINKINKRR